MYSKQQRNNHIAERAQRNLDGSVEPGYFEAPEVQECHVCGKRLDSYHVLLDGTLACDECYNVGWSDAYCDEIIGE